MSPGAARLHNLPEAVHVTLQSIQAAYLLPRNQVIDPVALKGPYPPPVGSLAGAQLVLSHGILPRT